MEILVTVDRRETFKIELPPGYFGTVQLQFVDAQVVLIRKEESLKPQKLQPDFFVVAS